MPDTFKSVLVKFYDEYKNSTPKRVKLIDSYLLYILLTGVIQFLYCVLVGTFPFNSFLSGFISCVGSFVLAGEYNIPTIHRCASWVFSKPDCTLKMVGDIKDFGALMHNCSQGQAVNCVVDELVVTVCFKVANVPL